MVWYFHLLKNCPQFIVIQTVKGFGIVNKAEIDVETVDTVMDFILGAPKSLQMVTAAMKLKDACSLEEKL